MDATFIELPAFERHREDYLSDESFRQLQKMLLANSRAGDVIEGTGGLRKVRFLDWRRQKGKRGGIRVIYYWRLSEMQFLQFTLYDKDEASDLTSSQKKVLKGLLERELRERMLK